MTCVVRIRRLGAIAVVLACAGTPAQAWAADATPPGTVAPPTAPAWTVTVGVDADVEPSSEGSRRDALRFYPSFDIRPAGTPERFHSARESYSITLFDQGNWDIGVAGTPRFPRHDISGTPVHGLFGVSWGAELGGFVDYWFLPWLRGRTELRQGVGAHHGIVSDLMADVVFPVTNVLTLSGGPRVTFATSAALAPYFSVDPLQSAATGLPVFDARGGLHTAGLGSQARYHWTKEWATNVFVEYDRLLGDAANSPIVTQRGTPNELTVGAGVTYSFDVKQFW